MIESNKDFGTFEIFCDEVGCDYSELYDTDGNWDAFISEAKKDGWLMFKNGNTWDHKCPGCNERKDKS